MVVQRENPFQWLSCGLLSSIARLRFPGRFQVCGTFAEKAILFQRTATVPFLSCLSLGVHAIDYSWLGMPSYQFSTTWILVGAASAPTAGPTVRKRGPAAEML